MAEEGAVTKETIAAYYDGHSRDVQERVGINRRHRSIIRRFKATGLKRHHHVLEIGCGVGQLTGLIAPLLPQGAVLAVDISSNAIATASQRLKGRSNVELAVDDMSAFSVDRRFDRIRASVQEESRIECASAAFTEHFDKRLVWPIFPRARVGERDRIDLTFDRLANAAVAMPKRGNDCA